MKTTNDDCVGIRGNTVQTISATSSGQPASTHLGIGARQQGRGPRQRTPGHSQTVLEVGGDQPGLDHAAQRCSSACKVGIPPLEYWVCTPEIQWQSRGNCS